MLPLQILDTKVGVVEKQFAVIQRMYVFVYKVLCCIMYNSAYVEFSLKSKILLLSIFDQFNGFVLSS
jgi:hypothetical protein